MEPPSYAKHLGFTYLSSFGGWFLVNSGAFIALFFAPQRVWLASTVFETQEGSHKIVFLFSARVMIAGSRSCSEMDSLLIVDVEVSPIFSFTSTAELSTMPFSWMIAGSGSCSEMDSILLVDVEVSQLSPSHQLQSSPHFPRDRLATNSRRRSFTNFLLHINCRALRNPLSLISLQLRERGLRRALQLM